MNDQMMFQFPLRPSTMANSNNNTTTWKSNTEIAPNCPRCSSANTKFCYYNNYSLSQPRYFCKGCRRYWTKGGSLRNVPVGGGCRKNRRSKGARISQSDRNYSGHSLTSLDSDQNESCDGSSGNSGGDIDLADVFAKYLNQKPSGTSEEMYTQDMIIGGEEEELLIPQGMNGDEELLIENYEINGLELLGVEEVNQDSLWSHHYAADLSHYTLQDFDGLPADEHEQEHGNDDQFKVQTNLLSDSSWCTSFDIPAFEVIARP